eukprot:12510279-Alexandrium_andersonii.AAC.1
MRERPEGPPEEEPHEESPEVAAVQREHGPGVAGMANGAQVPPEVPGQLCSETGPDALRAPEAAGEVAKEPRAEAVDEVEREPRAGVVGEGRGR